MFKRGYTLGSGLVVGGLEELLQLKVANATAANFVTHKRMRIGEMLCCLANACSVCTTGKQRPKHLFYQCVRVASMASRSMNLLAPVSLPSVESSFVPSVRGALHLTGSSRPVVLCGPLPNPDSWTSITTRRWHTRRRRLNTVMRSKV
jgi:hypothetical protein